MKKTIYNNKVALAALALLLSSASALAQNPLPERLYVYKGEVQDPSEATKTIKKVRYAKNLKRTKDVIKQVEGQTAIYEWNAGTKAEKWKKGTAEYDSISIFKPKSTSPYADDLALDVLFLDGGDAIDLSNNNMNVVRYGDPDCTYQNQEGVMQNIYNTKMSEWPQEGVPGKDNFSNPNHFRVPYTKEGLGEDLANGFTLETIFCINDDGFINTGNVATKWFSSMGGGGTGFQMDGYGSQLGFLVGYKLAGSQKTDGGYSYRVSRIITYSESERKTTLKSGVFYHLIGVYDPTKKGEEKLNKAMIYMKKIGSSEPIESGNIVIGQGAEAMTDDETFGYAGAPLWFGVGGDLGPNCCNESGKFTIVRARIYSHPKTRAEVETIMTNDSYTPAP